MNNDDFLKSIIPAFRELVEPTFDISTQIIFIVCGLILAVIFIAIGCYATRDYSSKGIVVTCFVIAAIPLLWTGANIKDIIRVKQDYNIAYENYLVQSET